MIEDIQFREALPSDGRSIVEIFRTTRRHDLPYLPDMYSPEGMSVFRDSLFANDQIEVALLEGRIVAFCARRPGWVDHLYVLPGAQGRGIGSALLARAMDANAKLQLWLFQKNVRAKRFYEKHGFRMAEMTDGLGNMEKEPDALYVWERH